MTKKTAVKLWNYYHDSLANKFYISEAQRDYIYKEYKRLSELPYLKHRIKIVIN